MDHDRALPGTIGGHVVQVKAFRKVEIELDGGALPHPANGILNFEVNFGAVERAAALINFVAPTLAIEGINQPFGGQIPDGVIANRFLWAGGEVDFVGLEIKGAEDGFGEVQNPQDFVANLLG